MKKVLFTILAISIINFTQVNADNACTYTGKTITNNSYGGTVIDNDSCNACIIDASADCDGDGYSNLEEMNMGSDPTRNNNYIEIVVNELNLTNLECIEWKNTSSKIFLISPLNRFLINTQSGGFITFKNNPGVLPGDNFLSDEPILPMNNSFSFSSLNSTLSSSDIFHMNSDKLGGNMYNSGLYVDAEKYIGLSYTILGQRRNIFLGKACIDKTPPVCSALLTGKSHEQKTGEDILWNEELGWSSSSKISVKKGTYVSSGILSDGITKYSSGNILSITGTLSDISTYTGKTIIIKGTGIVLGKVEEFSSKHTYTGSFVLSSTGYTPWDKNKILINDVYKDNLSGLKGARAEVKNSLSGNTVNSGSLVIVPQATFSGKLAYSRSSPEWNICTIQEEGGGICNSTLKNDIFSNKKINIMLEDRAGNIGYCSSQSSKVDVDFPVIKINTITDDVGNFIDFTQNVTITPNISHTINLTLDDSKRVDGDVVENYLSIYSPNIEDVINGVSGFSPSDFNFSNFFYCGKGKSKPLCELEKAFEQSWQKIHKFTSTGTTSSGVYLTDELKTAGLDNFIKNNIFFMKDAYFEKKWVYSTGANLDTHTIKTKSFTGAKLKDVLFTNSGRYLSDDFGFHTIDNISTSENTLNSTGLVAVQYKNGYDYLSNGSVDGKLAFKFFTKTGEEGPNIGDIFYLTFDFKDRAGNKLPVKYGLPVKGRIFAKILGNIASSQKIEKYDNKIQSFKQDESLLKKKIQKIKFNLKSVLRKAVQGTGTGIIINSLEDLRKFKTNLGSEDIYIVKNGDFIFSGSGGHLNLHSNGRPVSIITYGGNIIINSKFINASNNTSIIALKDTSLGDLYSQGNIFISPKLLLGRGQIISEGSLFSYLKIDGKEKVALKQTTRSTSFLNQLVWQGTISSENTIGGSSKKQCPVKIYGLNNYCGFSNSQENQSIIRASSISFDLHYLRSFDYHYDLNTKIVYPQINLGTGKILGQIEYSLQQIKENNISNITSNKTSKEQFSDFIRTIEGKTSLGNSIGTPKELQDIVKGLKEYVQYPVVIMQGNPDKKMKVFE